MRRLIVPALLAVFVTGFAAPNAAEAARPKVLAGFSQQQAQQAPVKVEISRATQKMNVYVGGKLRHVWAVSTGRKGFKTPRGAYKPTWMTKMWHSRQWQMAPMPHSIFFKDGYAIHATNEVGRLGRPASHGCVRLHPANAAKLFDLVKKSGEKNAKIVVS